MSNSQKSGDESVQSSSYPSLLTEILRQIPVRVFWKDAELRYLGCNALFARDAGFESPEEVIGKDDFQMAWREQAELYRADDFKIMSSGQPKLDFEEPQTGPDGRTIWLRTSKVPLRDSSGKIIGMPIAFQLAYGKYHDEHAIRWKADRGFTHYRVDDGEQGGMGKEAALLHPDGAFNAKLVLNQFLALSKEVPQDIVDFVSARLREHPEYHDDV